MKFFAFYNFTRIFSLFENLPFKGKNLSFIIKATCENPPKKVAIEARYLLMVNARVRKLAHHRNFLSTGKYF